MDSTCNLKYSLPKKNPIAFHNVSNHDYHFYHFYYKMVTRRIDNFTVSIEQEVTTIDKNGEKVAKKVSYIFSFISYRIHL